MRRMWHRPFGSVKARRRGREHGPTWGRNSRNLAEIFIVLDGSLIELSCGRVDQWVGDDACEHWLCGAGGGRDYHRHARLRGVLGVQRAGCAAGRYVGASRAVRAPCREQSAARSRSRRAACEGSGVARYSGTATGASNCPTVSGSRAAGTRRTGTCGASHRRGPATFIADSARRCAVRRSGETSAQGRRACARRAAAHGRRNASGPA
jgi:hypothetical protein